VYLIALAPIWNVCPSLAMCVADAKHNTTHDNHNTTPPHTVCEIIPTIDIPSLNTVRTTSRFPYTDADKKKHVFYYPLSHTERLRCLEDSLARALEQAEAAEEISTRITVRFTQLAGRSERRQRKLAHLSRLEASLALLEEGNNILNQRLTTLERLSVKQKQEL
ncbi:hypothetical protein PAXRUDRAFT_164921, partial [Paxillus rubicundulus Ve08.2h10]